MCLFCFFSKRNECNENVCHSGKRKRQAKCFPFDVVGATIRYRRRGQKRPSQRIVRMSPRISKRINLWPHKSSQRFKKTSKVFFFISDKYLKLLSISIVRVLPSLGNQIILKSKQDLDNFPRMIVTSAGNTPTSVEPIVERNRLFPELH